MNTSTTAATTINTTTATATAETAAHPVIQASPTPNVLQTAPSSNEILFELKPNPETWLYESLLPVTLSQLGVTDDEFAEFLVHCNTILNGFHQKKANYRAYIISILVLCVLLLVPTACISMIVFVASYFVLKRQLKLALRNCFLELLAFVEQQSYHPDLEPQQPAAVITATSAHTPLSISIPVHSSSGASRNTNEEETSGILMKGLFAKRKIISDVRFDPNPVIVFSRVPPTVLLVNGEAVRQPSFRTASVTSITPPIILNESSSVGGVVLNGEEYLNVGQSTNVVSEAVPASPTIQPQQSLVQEEIVLESERASMDGHQDGTMSATTPNNVGTTTTTNDQLNAHHSHPTTGGGTLASNEGRGSLSMENVTDEDESFSNIRM